MKRTDGKTCPTCGGDDVACTIATCGPVRVLSLVQADDESAARFVALHPIAARDRDDEVYRRRRRLDELCVERPELLRVMVSSPIARATLEGAILRGDTVEGALARALVAVDAARAELLGERVRHLEQTTTPTIPLDLVRELDESVRRNRKDPR